MSFFDPDVAAKGKRSQVWDYLEFLLKDGKVDKTTTVCNICSTTFVYKTGSTSSTSTTLKRKHNVSVSLAESLATAIKSSEVSTKKTTGQAGQLKLSDAFAKMSVFPTSSPRHINITRSIAVFLAKDMRHYSVVDNEGFKAMVRELAPRYKIPSRKHFSDNVIPKL